MVLETSMVPMGGKSTGVGVETRELVHGEEGVETVLLDHIQWLFLQN